MHVMLFLECLECRFNQSNNHKARKCAPCAEQRSCVGPVSFPEATIYCHQSHWLPKYVTSPQSQSGSFILNVILSIVCVFMLLCWMVLHARRGQRKTLGNQFHLHMGRRDQTQILRPGSQCLYLQRFLATKLLSFWDFTSISQLTLIILFNLSV